MVNWVREVKNGICIEYCILKEGVVVWFDVLVILCDVKNVE